MFFRFKNSSSSLEKTLYLNLNYKHNHSYTFKYLQYNKNKHYAYCECGNKTLLSHPVKIDSNNNKVCLNCGANLNNGGTGIAVPGF